VALQLRQGNLTCQSIKLMYKRSGFLAGVCILQHFVALFRYVLVYLFHLRVVVDRKNTLNACVHSVAGAWLTTRRMIASCDSWQMERGIQRLLISHWNKQTPWPLVRKRTIPTERSPLNFWDAIRSNHHCSDTSQWIVKTEDTSTYLQTDFPAKNAAFWDVTLCGSWNNRRFEGAERLNQQSDKNRWTRKVSSN
jgi:hypothetical protein